MQKMLELTIVICLVLDLKFMMMLASGSIYTFVWSKLNMTSHILPPQDGHTTISLGENLFVVGDSANHHSLSDD